MAGLKPPWTEPLLTVHKWPASSRLGQSRVQRFDREEATLTRDEGAAFRGEAPAGPAPVDRLGYDGQPAIGLSEVQAWGAVVAGPAEGVEAVAVGERRRKAQRFIDRSGGHHRPHGVQGAHHGADRVAVEAVGERSQEDRFRIRGSKPRVVKRVRDHRLDASPEPLIPADLPVVHEEPTAVREGMAAGAQTRSARMTGSP